MVIDNKVQFRISDEVVSQEIDGETVLLDMQGEEYFGLNEVGTRVWQLLQQPSTIDILFSTMIKEYAVNEKELRGDLNDIIQQLLSAGLIVREQPDSDD